MSKINKTAHSNISKRLFSKIGLFEKINLSIILTFILVLVITCVLITNMLVFPSVEKSNQLNEEATIQLNALVSKKYTSLFGQMHLIHGQEHVGERLGQLSGTISSSEKNDNLSFIYNYTSSLGIIDRDIVEVIIISAAGHEVFSYSNKVARRLSATYDYYALPIIAELLDSSYSIVAGSSISQDYASRSEELLTFAMQIKDPSFSHTSEPVGVMLVSYPQSLFDSEYRKLGSISGGNACVVNHAGTIIYSTNKDNLGGTVDQIIETSANIVNAQHLVSTSGMKTVELREENYRFTEVSRLVKTELLIIVPAVMLLLLTVILLNRQYRIRVNHIAQAMHDFNANGKAAPMTVMHHDELAFLTNQLNDMCSRLEAQIRLNYKAELARKTAELNALQAQINPHFLYNTIEGIRMCAIDNNDVDVSNMLMQLGQLFHWMIQLDKRIVYIEDEIEYNEAYLNLQRLRYDDSFDSEILISDNVLYLGIPKFTLQPIIENALLHGMRENRIVGKITVTGYAKDGLLTLQIADNGKGMKQEQLERLRNHVVGKCTDPQFGIGLKNVHSRIQLLFGNIYGLSIDSKLGEGTTVSVNLPAMKKKEMESMVVQSQTNEEGFEV